MEEAEAAVMAALLPSDEEDARGVVLEVRAGAGGEEASLFALDLFRMYERYCALRRWKFDVRHTSSSLLTSPFSFSSSSSFFFVFLLLLLVLLYMGEGGF